MKARTSLVVLLVAIALTLGFAGCSRYQGRSDAQIAGDVQSKIFGDPSVQSRQVTVNSSDGVVTLSGTVGSQAEWNAASNAAGQVEGVKRVVNNLEVQEAAAPPVAEPYAPPTEPVAAAPAPRRRARAPEPGLRRSPKYSGTQTASSDYSSAPSTYSAPAASAPAVVRPVTIPDGTTLSIRLIDALDSETNHPGDTFRATLDSPVTIGEAVVIPADADVQGRVVDVKSAGRFAGQSSLAIELNKVSFNGKSYEIQTSQYARQGKGRGKSTATKVGGGAALGAIIGGIAGGGKGAAIGATIGAGAGTGVSAATKGEQIRLSSEQVFQFRLQNPVTVMPSATNNRSAGRNVIDQ